MSEGAEEAAGLDEVEILLGLLLDLRVDLTDLEVVKADSGTMVCQCLVKKFKNIEGPRSVAMVVKHGYCETSFRSSGSGSSCSAV